VVPTKPILKPVAALGRYAATSAGAGKKLAFPDIRVFRGARSTVMKLIGITGGVGMGKSTSEKLLRERGVPVLDTDQLARDLVEPGQPALAEIGARFGDGLVGADGRLLRGKLANRVFNDAPSRRDLEAILHPRIRERWLAEAARWRAEGQPLGAVAIPLLYETGAEQDLDVVLCVACGAATQRERLRQRGWSEEESSRRIASQMPVEQKLALAQFVVWTEGDLIVHAAQLERILARLT
jgi:dephospho-CoA kinase